MLNSSSVVKNIDFCEMLFNQTADPIKKLFLIRMALLEVCGWIEEYLDEIYSYNPKNLDIGQYQIMYNHIHNLSSFEYTAIIKSIALSIGVFNMYALEQKFQTNFLTNFTTFKSSLNSLKAYRNEYAHKNTESCTNTIGFNGLRIHFRNVRLGLYFLEKSIKQIHRQSCSK